LTSWRLERGGRGAGVIARAEMVEIEETEEPFEVERLHTAIPRMRTD
jgi:hypothetical protein